jgi:hypothetical protein
MKNIRPLLFVCLTFILNISFQETKGQEDAAVLAITKHRQKQEKVFRNPKESPLEKKDRRHFKGLNYYAIDLDYRVHVKFVKTEHPVLFKMKTTTTREPDYLKYGEVHFTLMGNTYRLNVYQSPDIIQREGYADYLFIPFTDETNGKETYAVGRYLEFRIPTSEEIILDFNQCYNPYCSYSGRYSCPIPPAENYLPLEITAGEKLFKDAAH